MVAEEVNQEDTVLRFLRLGAQAVFIVDDDVDDRLILRNHVRKIFEKDIDIHLLKNGDELINQIEIENEKVPPRLGGRERKPWLVFLDLHMPKVGGVEALKKLQTFNDIDNVLLMIVSGSQDCVEIDSAYKNGAYAFLPKPFSKFSFNEALHRQAKKDKAASKNK